jgi:hypothetical protein
LGDWPRPPDAPGGLWLFSIWTSSALGVTDEIEQAQLTNKRYDLGVFSASMITFDHRTWKAPSDDVKALGE